MKLLQIIQAFKALTEIRKMQMPYSKARCVNQIYRLFEKEYVFYSEEENKLIEKYALKDEHGNALITNNNVITFANADVKCEYMEKITELNNCEIDAEIIPVNLKGSEIGGQIISPEALEKLDGIIIFC